MNSSKQTQKPKTPQARSLASLPVVKRSPVAPLVKSSKMEVPVVEEKKAPKVVIKIKEKKNKKDKHKGETLARMNPWLNAILSPSKTHGVKVPDEITTPSCTFTIWDHRQIVANTNGVVSVAFGVCNSAFPSAPKGSLIPMPLNPSTDSYGVGCVNNNAALTTSNIFGNSGATSPTTITLPQWNSITTTVPKTFSQARMVSFESTIQNVSNLVNSAGTITFVSAPRRWLREFVGQNWNIGGITLATLQTHPSTRIVSIPKFGGGSVIWKPIDNFSWLYTDLTHIIDVASEEFPDEALGGEVYIVVTGAAPGQTFQLDTCWNFEGIPSTNQLDLIEPGISKADSISMEHALNILPAVPTSLPIPADNSLKNPLADVEGKGEQLLTEPHPAQESTMFEKIFDGIDTVVDRGSKVVGKLSPLLAGLL